jgi:putative CocE/NonD family hydrolase
MRQPYGRAIASTVTYAHPSWYAQHGFVVVVQDVRGRGESEGHFQGFAQEASDGADAVRWVRQLPSCNGRVGTYGFSYQGLSQLLNDGIHHGGIDSDGDGLPDCLAPAMAGLNERIHWASEGGAHWWALGLGWGLQLAAQRCQRQGDDEGWQAIRDSLERGSFLGEGMALLERHDPTGMALEWLNRNPADPAGWRVHTPSAALLSRPMLLLGGWHDPHLGGVLDLWHRSKAAGGSPQLRIGAWSHLHWPGGADAMQLAFFQQHLQGIAPGSAQTAPVALQAEPHGPWLVPAATPPRAWRLQGQALLDWKQASPAANPAGSPPPDHATRQLVHDPWRPVPGRGGHLDLKPGPCERSDLDERRDVACFTSAPLEAAELLLGQFSLEISISADQPGFDLCGALSVVKKAPSPPQGSAKKDHVQQLCTGVARFLGCGCLRSETRQLQFQPVMANLEAGDHLRLSLAASAWPQIALNPGDGSMPLGGPSPKHRVITLNLELATGHLRLEPIVQPGQLEAN